MNRKALLGVGLLVASALAGLPALSCRAPELGLVDGRLRDCPESPNCVCSEPGAGAMVAPIELGDADPDVAFGELVQLVDAWPRTEVVVFEEAYAHIVFVSAWFRFRDDVELRLDRAAGRVHLRSASRVGYSDLGANRARVERLRELWLGRETD